MDKRELLRSIPKIDEVLQERRLCVFFEDTPRELIVESVRESIEEVRRSILALPDITGSAALSEDEAEQGEMHSNEWKAMDYAVLMDQIVRLITEKRRKSLRRTVNATGVVLHTNLGRARLSKAAGECVLETALNYSTLEYDVKKGARGSRHDHVENIITKITGAEAAMVVNNNAAATMLCLSSMAQGREVIVSRGELVEIGGSFRVPEIMSQSGARLKEVGTTNKTKAADYRNAVNEDTGALMKVHTSNYRIIGFTEEVSLEEMVQLGKDMELPVIYDMGSGLMCDLEAYGIQEPTVTASLKTGIDVILFSGDKLLGGPQGGILAGKKTYIDAMKKHPLARVLRVDKMTLAAMEATFRAYLDKEKAWQEIPVLRMITAEPEALKVKALQLAELIGARASNLCIEVEETENQVGGGSAPTVFLSGYAAVVSSEHMEAEKMERWLRKQEIPVIARINKGKLYLEVRTLEIEELAIVADAFAEIGLFARGRASRG